MWLIYAIFASSLFASINIIDANCVRKLFAKPWIGTIVGAITTSILLIAVLPYFLPFLQFHNISWKIISLCIFTGFLLQTSNTFYFNALIHSEAGIVSAYWNMVPAIVPLFSFFIFNEILILPHYLGISALILTSICFYSIDSSLRGRWHSFVLMVIACLILAIVYLLQDIIFNSTSYLSGFMLIHFGVVIAGLLPLLIPRIRLIFKHNLTKLYPLVKVLILFELINITAIALLQRAIALDVPSKVAAIETTIPGFTFLFSVFLCFFYPKFGDIRSKKNITTKISLVGMMVIGVSLLSQ